MAEPHLVRPNKRRRIFTIITPLLLLLLCLGLLNSLPRPKPAAPPPLYAKSGNGRSHPRCSGPHSNREETAVLPTQTTPPTATAIPLPVFPPTATITLLGPPADSRLLADDSLTLYWTWSEPLAEDQYFGVYLRDETGDVPVGRLAEANLGMGYRWQTAVNALTDSGGEIQLLVKLETIRSETPLLSSEPRTFVILSE
ncbi:MAG: hypothetical protein M5U34_38720 [Chloroflexi bacterium]|nr:hypothetical protein [Chloroflexota bacterium]